MPLHRTSSWATKMILLALSVVSRRPGAGAFRSVFPNTARARRSRSLRWEGSSSTDSTTPTESSDDKFAAFRNRNNRDDQVFSAMSGDGGIKVTAATVRNLLNDMSLQHTMTATPTDAMGRTVTCGLLLANGIQDEQIVQITMNGTYPWLLRRTDYQGVSTVPRLSQGAAHTIVIRLLS
jgi:hypothetical protein